MAAAVASGETPAAPPENAPVYSFGRPWPEKNSGISYTDVISSRHSGVSLANFYSSQYSKSAPLQGWLQRIRNGQIAVNGNVVTDPDATLSDGSVVVYQRLPWSEPPVPFMLDVLYEDDDMIAVNKPSGLQVLPGGQFQQRTVLMQLQWKSWDPKTSCFSKRESSQSHPVPVHRLGRGTSGVLLCAKSKFAKVQLASYFAKKTANYGVHRNEPGLDKVQQISKIYRALVTGIIEDNEVVVNQPIGLVHYPGVAEGLYAASLSGKPAMSKIYVTERRVQQNQTLVQVEIHSGRPHQIRIHLAYIGHPLLDDPLYGDKGLPRFGVTETLDCSIADDGGYQKPSQAVPGDCGYHLHAHWLEICHPRTKKAIVIAAPLPHSLRSREELPKEEDHGNI